MSATIAGYCPFQLLGQVNYTLTYFARQMVRNNPKKFVSLGNIERGPGYHRLKEEFEAELRKKYALDLIDETGHPLDLENDSAILADNNTVFNCGIYHAVTPIQDAPNQERPISVMQYHHRRTPRPKGKKSAQP